MFPSFSTKNSLHSRFRYTESSCEFAATNFASGIVFSDSQDFVVSEFGVAIICPKGLSVAKNFIVHIILISANIKMGRIAASWGITMMTDFHIFRDWSENQFKHNSMGGVIFVIHTDFSVFIFINPLAKPTFPNKIRIRDIKFFPYVVFSVMNSLTEALQGAIFAFIAAVIFKYFSTANTINEFTFRFLFAFLGAVFTIFIVFGVFFSAILAGENHDAIPFLDCV